MKKLMILLVLALIVVSVMPVMAQDDDMSFMEHAECGADLTGETVTFYHIGDLSGAYAFITQPFLAALEDAILYYNEAGTLCGATIVQEYEDTAGDQSKTQSAYDRFSTLNEKPLLLLLYASADAELLRERVMEDEIPALISAGSAPGLYGEDSQTPGWIYATNPLYTDQLGMFCDFVAANPEMYPEPVIGYISWEGAFGRAADTEEVWGYCDYLGVGHAGSEFFLPTSQDISNQVQNLVDNGANILYTNSLATGPVLVANTVVGLGLDVHMAGVNWALDTSVGLLGQATFNDMGLPAVDGMVGSLPFAWWTERGTNPGVAFISQQAEVNARSLPNQNIAYLLGWQAMDVFIELYIRAGNEVGYDNIDGAAINAQLENFQFSPLGTVDLDFTEGVRDASANRIAVLKYLGEDGMSPAGDGVAPMVVQAGDNQLLVPILVPLTDWMETPDLRPGGADVVGD